MRMLRVKSPTGHRIFITAKGKALAAAKAELVEATDCKKSAITVDEFEFPRPTKANLLNWLNTEFNEAEQELVRYYSRRAVHGPEDKGG